MTTDTEKVGSFDPRAYHQVRDRIQQFRAARELRMIDALSRLSPKFSMVGSWTKFGSPRFAALHHTLYEVFKAAPKKDVEHVAAALDIWQRAKPMTDRIVETPMGPMLFVSKSECIAYDDPFYGSTPYVLSGRVARDNNLLQALPLEEAFGFVTRCDSAALLDPSPGIVVLLDGQEPDGAITSYTLAGLPATIFTDWSGSAVRFGESIIHEGIHCWLNEAIKALGEELPVSATEYSPWKGTERPAFNFLHAVMAFSGLVHYFATASASGRLSDWESRYCTQRAEAEMERLLHARAGVERTVKLLRYAPLHDLVVEHFTSALSWGNISAAKTEIATGQVN